MARLEFEFVSVGAKSVDNELNNIKTSFSNVNGLLKDNIKDSIIYSNALKEVSSKLKQAGGSNEYLIKEQLELKGRLNDVNATIRQQIKDFDSVDGSLVQLRANLSLANKAYDNLSKTARQGNIGTQLGKQIQSLNQEISKAEQATGRYQRQVGNYEKAQGNANGVAMEFNRIIQDAPFGMMGMGNNIQQLAANWQTYTSQVRAAAAANGTTVTSMGLVRGAFSALLSPANLLTLGIAAVTSAWTYYSMNVKTAKEETKDMNNQFTSQIGALNNVIALSKKQSLTERDKATAINLYNKELGDTLGKIKTYSELEKSLIRNGSNYVNYLSLKAQAEATYQLSLKQTAQMMTNIMSLESKGRSTGFLGWVSKASDTIDELVYGEGTQGKTKISSAEAMKIAQLPTDKEFYIAIRGMGDALKRGLKDVRADWKKSVKSADLGADLTQSFNKIADKLKIPMPNIGLDSINNSLNKTTDKLKQAIDYLKELQSLSGVSEKDISLVGKVGLDFDVASIKYDYEERIKQIQTLQEQILADTTLTEAKRKELIEETNTYIAYLTGNVLANIKDLSNKATEYLDKMTVKAVKTYKDVEIVESPKQRQGRNREDDRNWREYANILNQSVNYIFTNLETNVKEFGLGFNSVLFSASDTLKSMFDSLNSKNNSDFITKLTEVNKNTGLIDIKENWKSIKNDTVEMSKAIGSAMGMVGNLVSNLSKSTSSFGQGVGGALSGAGAGLSMGTMLKDTLGKNGGLIGAGIGAVVGLIGGIFGAKKARKQEELQRKQLEEQKKANALLERMSALTYASQIIGQKTEYGIVSGVRRNEFGQIVSVVQGQDIIMIADRTNKQKGR